MLSIIMPCLNEEKTVGACIDRAKVFLRKNDIIGEILVVDNGSHDHSKSVAIKHGATVISEERRGYGRAIRAGIKASKGQVIIIGDCDLTYDFVHLKGLYDPLKNNKYDMVIGDRFVMMEHGAMPVTHRLGVRFLSLIGRRRYRVGVHDFHCGLRGITRDAVNQLSFHTNGMEFATEMIAVAAKKHMKIGQIRITYHRCPYKRESKLRTVRDGFRHLNYLLHG